MHSARGYARSILAVINDCRLAVLPSNTYSTFPSAWLRMHKRRGDPVAAH